jgi:hypothetical protein
MGQYPNFNNGNPILMGENLVTNGFYSYLANGNNSPTEQAPYVKSINHQKHYAAWNNMLTGEHKEMQINCSPVDNAVAEQTQIDCIADGPGSTPEIFQVTTTGWVKEVSQVQTIADVSGSLDGKYFNIYSYTSGHFYVWMNVDGGGNDPSPGGSGIPVPISSNDSANTIAAAINSAINGDGSFSSTVSTNTVVITNNDYGNVTNSADVDTGFTITTVAQGNSLDGAVDGTYFYAYDTAGGSPSYYVWMNLDGSGSDPGAGDIGIQVNVTTGDSANTIAEAIKNALNGVGANWSASRTGNVITTTISFNGPIADASNLNTPFTVAVTQDGQISVPLNNKYFYISSPTVNYYVWYDVSGGGTDPAIGGKTGIQVAINSDDSEYTVASATANALIGTGIFTAGISVASVTATCVALGNTTNAADVNTTFVITTTQEGGTTYLISGGDYFTFSSGNGSADLFYLWFKVDGSGTDPAVVGRTGILCSVATGDNESSISASITAAILGNGTAFSDMQVFQVGSSVKLLMKQSGSADTPATGAGLVNFAYYVNDSKYRVEQQLYKTTNGGVSWTELLASHPEWKSAGSRCLFVSDDGNEILVWVCGNPGALGAYPYSTGELRFNRSTDGGATWANASGSWVMMTNGVEYYDSYTNKLQYEVIMCRTGSFLIAIYRGDSNAQTVYIQRSDDNGVTWNTPSVLAGISGATSNGQRAMLQNCAVDNYLAFSSYNYNDYSNVTNPNTQSYLYYGTYVDTYTRWLPYGV